VADRLTVKSIKSAKQKPVTIKAEMKYRNRFFLFMAQFLDKFTL